MIINIYQFTIMYVAIPSQQFPTSATYDTETQILVYVQILVILFEFALNFL